MRQKLREACALNAENSSRKHPQDVSPENFMGLVCQFSPKLIYRLDTIPIQVPVGLFFFRNRQTYFKILMEM